MKELERERIRLAQQQLSEQHSRAAELALLEQGKVVASAEAAPAKLRAKTGAEWESHCGGPAMLDLLESTDLVDAQYLIALGNNGGVVPRWQELPESAKITRETAWRLHCWGGSYCLCAPAAPDPAPTGCVASGRSAATPERLPAIASCPLR